MRIRQCSRVIRIFAMAVIFREILYISRGLGSCKLPLSTLLLVLEAPLTINRYILLLALLVMAHHSSTNWPQAKRLFGSETEVHTKDT